MPILRAGPWGSLSDSHQLPPGEPAAGEAYGIYPVNVGGVLSFAGRAWQATYAVKTIDTFCCTPCKIVVDFPATDDFGATFRRVIRTIYRGTNDTCYYGYAENPDDYYRGDVFFLKYLNGSWLCYFGNEDFAQADSFIYGEGQPCSPTGEETISGTYFYDGQKIYITDPSA